MNRRNFLRLGTLFVPVVAAPTVAYSFCGGWKSPEGGPIIFTKDSVRLHDWDVDFEISKGGVVVSRGMIVNGKATFTETGQSFLISGGRITFTARHTGAI